MGLLLLRSEAVDRIHDERPLHGDEAADAGIDTLELLHDEAVLDVGHAGAAVAFEVRAEEAELGHFGDQLGGKTGVAVAIANQRQDSLLGESARGLPNHALLFGEERVDREVVYSSKGHVDLLEHDWGRFAPRGPGAGGRL